MIIKYYCQDRGSGKTEHLIHKFNSKPDVSLFFTFNNDSVKHLKRSVDERYWKRIKSFSSLPNSLRGYRGEQILIDEYDYLENKLELTYYIMPILTQDAQIIIKTTPKNHYKKINLELAKLSHFNPKIDFSHLSSWDLMEINELRESLISHPKTKIYDKCTTNGMFQ